MLGGRASRIKSICTVGIPYSYTFPFQRRRKKRLSASLFFKRSEFLLDTATKPIIDTGKNPIRVCLLIRFVSCRVCLLIRFVSCRVCRLKIFFAYRVCRLLRFVSCRVCLLIRFVSCRVCLLKIFVAYRVCRLLRFVSCRVCHLIRFVSCRVCRLIRFVSCRVCRLKMFVAYRVCRLLCIGYVDYGLCRSAFSSSLHFFLHIFKIHQNNQLDYCSALIKTF